MYRYMKHGSQLSLTQQKLVMVKCNIIVKGYYGIVTVWDVLVGILAEIHKNYAYLIEALPPP